MTSAFNMLSSAPHLSIVTSPRGASFALSDEEIRRVESRVTLDDAGCWIWTGRRLPTGYGRCWLRGEEFYSHRLTYMLIVGPIPEGLHLDHLCRVRECCHPHHLEPVTCAENIHRSPIATAAVNARKTHCKRGHELVGSNLRIDGHGRRQCRSCVIAAGREQYAVATGVPLNDSPIDLDAPTVSRRPQGATACAKGHDLNSQNTYVDRKGREHCRACRAAAQARYEAKKKARIRVT